MPWAASGRADGMINAQIKAQIKAVDFITRLLSVQRVGHGDWDEGRDGSEGICDSTAASQFGQPPRENCLSRRLSSQK